MVAQTGDFQPAKFKFLRRWARKASLLLQLLPAEAETSMFVDSNAVVHNIIPQVRALTVMLLEILSRSSRPQGKLGSYTALFTGFRRGP
jgi:hypothetical protein